MASPSKTPATDDIRARITVARAERERLQKQEEALLAEVEAVELAEAKRKEEEEAAKAKEEEERKRKEEEESKHLDVVRDGKRKASAILVEEGEEDDDASEPEGSGKASVSHC
jgi:hypothetical protein